MPMRKETSIVFKMNLIFINFAIKKWGIGDNSDTKIISAPYIESKTFVLENIYILEM